MSTEDRLTVLRDRTQSPNADNWPHLTYFDQETGLSFYWNGAWQEGCVGIGHGGYGEPILGYLPNPYPQVEGLSLYQYMIDFDMLCKVFVRRYKATKERVPNGQPALLVEMTLGDFA